jgi:hypothetical protein
MRTRVFFLRFREREDTAEIFLTRAEYLPPLNFNREIDEKGRMDLSNRSRVSEDGPQPLSGYKSFLFC